LCQGSCTAHLMHCHVLGLRLETAPHPIFGPLWASCSLTIPFPSSLLCFSLLSQIDTIRLTHAHPLQMDVTFLGAQARNSHNSKRNAQALCTVSRATYMSHLLSLLFNRCLTVQIISKTTNIFQTFWHF
jgi:hypothetical protein